MTHILFHVVLCRNPMCYADMRGRRDLQHLVGIWEFQALYVLTVTVCGTGSAKSMAKEDQCFTTSSIHQSCLQADNFTSLPQKNDDYCRDSCSLEPVTEDACFFSEAIQEQERYDDLESRDALFGLHGAAFDVSDGDTDTQKPRIVLRKPFMQSPIFGSSFEDEYRDPGMRISPTANLAQTISTMFIRGSGNSVRYAWRILPTLVCVSVCGMCLCAHVQHVKVARGCCVHV